MSDQSCGREASPNRVRGQFMADTRASKLKGKYGTITEVYSVNEISNSAGHK